MNTIRPFKAGARRARLGLSATTAGLVLGLALQAQAQAQAQSLDTPIATSRTSIAAPAPAPSSNATINLIRLLVAQGTISQQAADALVSQAEAEAATARGQTAAPPPPAANVLRVPYVPQIVRDQIRDEVRDEVMIQAQDEGWADRGAVPTWVGRIEWSGDFRARNQSELYSSNNASDLVDFAAFNSAGPIDVNDLINPGGIPFLNTRRDRVSSPSLRARLSLKAKLTDAMTVGVRLASGRDSGPVSTTQSLGGGFSKKDIWLDQAYININPTPNLGLTVGRMPDPFAHTELVFDDDLNFDGLAASAATNSDSNRLNLFGSAGAFPLEVLSSNFPTNSAAKARDRTKWLLAAQWGAQWTPNATWIGKASGAYYDFTGLQGAASATCSIYLGARQCSSDPSRPAFMQKGNTVFFLRDIAPNPASPLNYAQPQFVGLSQKFQLADLNLEATARLQNDNQLTVQADFVRNLAYSRKAAFKGPRFDPLNNYDSGPVGAVGPYRSGGDAWMLRLAYGVPKPTRLGEWNVGLSYRYIQPDAVPDGYNDSDFHLGGSNTRGYTVSAAVGLNSRTSLAARWMSADEVYGPPLAIDVLQVELNASF